MHRFLRPPNEHHGTTRKDTGLTPDSKIPFAFTRPAGMRTKSNGRLASSMVEQLTLNQLVSGSSPERGTNWELKKGRVGSCPLEAGSYRRKASPGFIHCPCLPSWPHRPFKTAVDFNREVRPLLSDTCFACHGPDAAKRKSGLRLDDRAVALAPAKSGKPAIVPGKPDESELVKRIFTTDADDLMPPEESHKKLTPVQKETLKQWIAEGAEYRGHWAFEAPVSPAIPQLPTPAASPIDAFLAARLAKEGLAPQPEAPKETLISRVSLDLTGLPPTLAEVDAFLADTSPQAYDKVVDRLLASPR